MNIDQLRQFDEVARAGTMIAAADALGMSQSALSRSIARLESELGIQLFERRGRSIELSAKGEAVLEYVRAMLREERLMRSAIEEMSERTASLLVGTVAPAPLWRLTAISVERFPEQMLISKREAQQNVVRDLVNGDIDLGISLGPVSHPSLRCCHLMDERLRIGVPRSHPLAKKESLAADDLAGESFLMGDNVGFWGQAVRKALPRSEFIVQQDDPVLQQMAATSSLLTFVTDAPYQSAQDTDRIAIPFDDPCASASFYLLVRADATDTAQTLFNAV